MTGLFSCIKRNCKLFFKDKAMLFTSLITPIILLVLYVTFLSNVYKSSLVDNFNGIEMEQKIVNGMVAGQLLSSLLAVSCITVAFCSNLLMVQDKVNGSINDLLITPAKKWMVAISYYISTEIIALIISLVATGGCLIYVACVGWYISASEVFLILLDVVLLTMFGTALSSIINFFLTTQGQISAVGTIVSAGYGFICGAYMPIAFFGRTLQTVLCFLPGTYGTALIRNHAMSGPLRAMTEAGCPAEVCEGIKDSLDLNLYFFGNKVAVWVMYFVLCLTIAVLVAVFIIFNVFANRKKK